MGLYSIKPAFRQLLRGLLPWLKPVHPDVLTWAAVACSLGCGVLFSFASRNRWFFLLIPFLFFVRIALNALDGLLAQETGKARPFGEVLNELTDRLSDAAILLGLAYSPLASAARVLPVLAVVLISSTVGIIGKAVGVGRQYGGVLGKADRMLWLGLACILAFFGLDYFERLLALFLVLGTVTVLQRVWRIHELLKGVGGGFR